MVFRSIALLSLRWLRVGPVRSAPPPASPAPNAPAPSNLRTEYLENPVGIDVVRPRFSWILEHTERGQKQTAYQVLVSLTPEIKTGDVWDSGRVSRANPSWSPTTASRWRAGRPTTGRSATGTRPASPAPTATPPRFEMGLLAAAEWKGKWIGGANQLRKEFVLKAPPAARPGLRQRARLLRAAHQRPEGRRPRARSRLDDLRAARPLLDL